MVSSCLLSGHADTPDADYMQVNIKLVRNFFRSVERDAFHAEVRYEDLRNQPAMALRSLAGAIGLNVSEETVHRVADEYKAERLAERGRAGNLYRGLAVSPPDDELVEMAKEDLADIRERFGY